MLHTTRHLRVSAPIRRTPTWLHGSHSRRHSLPTLPIRPASDRTITSSTSVFRPLDAVVKRPRNEDKDDSELDVHKMTEEENSLNRPREELEHAVISAFDLFSIGGVHRCYLA